MTCFFMLFGKFEIIVLSCAAKRKRTEPVKRKLLNDMVAFEQFYKESYMTFYYLVYNMLEDEEASKDIVGDCFEYVWHNHREENVRNWKAYMYSVVRNKCIDSLRKQEVKKKYVDFYTSMFAEEWDEYSDEEDTMSEVYKILDKLPPLTRQVLEGCFLEKKKYKEVAEEKSISTSTVKKHIIKALKVLRDGMLKKTEKR